MEIRLVNGNKYDVKTINENIKDGCLEIVFDTRTAEELKEIFCNKATLNTIELYSEGIRGGSIYNFVVLNKIELLPDGTKKVILTKETDNTTARILAAETKAVEAATIAAEAVSAVTEVKATAETLQATVDYLTIVSEPESEVVETVPTEEPTTETTTETLVEETITTPEV